MNINLITIFLLSFTSGLPFLLILSTLAVWLAEIGISNTIIGLFAVATIPYTMKIFFVPIIDHYMPPIFYEFGKRRGWLLCNLLCLMVSVILLGSTNPSLNLYKTLMAAIAVGFFSALLDIVIDTYRIEVIDKKQIGLGASISSVGYKIGMLCSGAGTLFLAEYFNSWQRAYNVIAALFLIGVFATLIAREPKEVQTHTKTNWYELIVVPFLSFKEKQSFYLVIAFIMSYKVADTVLNVMTSPFLVDIGFNKLEIAEVAKTFGISAMIIGSICGGVILTRTALHKTLILTVFLQILASALFVLQAYIGYDLELLFLTMGVENFSCGLSQVALLAYLSSLCSKSFSAMHFALLSSFSSLVRVLFSFVTGILADIMPWSSFYCTVVISCIPSLILLFVFSKHFLIQDDALNTYTVRKDELQNAQS